MNKKESIRIAIFPQDVERLTGLSSRSVRRILRDMRKRLGKKRSDILTITEFCAEAGLTEEQVRPFMSD